MTTSALEQACEEWFLFLLTVFGPRFASAAEVVGTRSDGLGIIDIVTYIILFILIAVIAWLSNNEIKKSLIRYQISEESLRKERDNLELRLSRRTVELLDIGREKTTEIRRIAQFGELSQGLFHDLMSPLASLSLYVEKLALKGQHLEDTGTMIEKVVDSSRRMRSFMDSVKRCLGNGDSLKGNAELSSELFIARDILAYKARMANVQLIIDRADPFTANIHPVRIHQLFVNLMSNAIEACGERSITEKDNARNSYVKISVTSNQDHASIQIADNGCGISPENKKDIFSISFSSKSSGLGMGLSTVRTIVEDELKGSIRLESALGSGTTFLITVPK